MPTPWNDDRVAALKNLWAVPGISATQIAQELGLYSRNAVIGKALRLGLGRRPGGAGPRMRRPVERVARPDRSTPFRRPPALHVTETIVSQLSGSGTILLDDLKDHHCRWPYGERAPFLFCGSDKADGSPYCAAHSAVAFRDPKTRKDARP